ncbi:hypothetical protein [Nocardia sp. CA-120079]|uniref:hypothetical protein n=1 Tax=Nocardia sp. CA-120079 TaxID=3239974 RepID=UPI003D984B10
MPLTPTDPIGSYFDGWAVPTPAGEWHYELDDWGIYYGAGWWPFHQYYEQTHGPSRLAPASIRVSPDTAYQSWRNESILLWPCETHPNRVDARPTLFVRTQGLGAIVAKTDITLDIKQRATTIASTCPPQLREQAETKAARLLRFVLDHRRARRRGITEPETAYGRWIHRTQHRYTAK